MYFDPKGCSGAGAVSYYKNGWLINTVPRAGTFTNGSVANVFRWGSDSVPSATSTQRWSLVEFASGNRVIAPVPLDGTIFSVR
jgi:hypothetical protein